MTADLHRAAFSSFRCEVMLLKDHVGFFLQNKLFLKHTQACADYHQQKMSEDGSILLIRSNHEYHRDGSGSLNAHLVTISYRP